jgi:AraC-like DNA-binding protein
MTETVDPIWRTSSYTAVDRYDAWSDKLKDTYGAWSIGGWARPDFHAEIEQRTVQNLRMVSCVCDPCGATRKRAEIARDGFETLAVQVVVSGREHFTIDNRTAVLGPGDVLIWRLEKISVMMPLARLRGWLPQSWHSIASSLPQGSPGASLLNSFIRSMAPDFLSGNLRNGEALTEALIGLVVSALDAEKSVVDACSLRDAQLLLVKQYIERHLGEPELSPGMIAEANRISLRYLHCLFEPEGTTVLQYIIRERLQRCRRELSNPLMATRTITDIAFSWGFQSSTHFSRRFRDAFGLSPNEYRRGSSPSCSEGDDFCRRHAIA